MKAKTIQHNIMSQRWELEKEALFKKITRMKYPLRIDRECSRVRLLLSDIT